MYGETVREPKKCPHSRKSAEAFFLGIIYFASLCDEAIDVESLLPILQHGGRQ